jgi:hypothetical protein
MLSSDISFWGAWLLPMLLLVPFFVAALVVWRNATPRTVSSENARTPYVAGVSVLAIAIPLVANLRRLKYPRQQSVIGSLVFFSLR